MATNTQRNRRHRRIRARMSGTAECPRVVVFRSNTGLYAQAIDDTIRKTLVGLKTKQSEASKVEESTALAAEMAKGLESLGVKRIVFDRGGYQYHGRVKAFAEGLRAAGLQF